MKSDFVPQIKTTNKSQTAEMMQQQPQKIYLLRVSHYGCWEATVAAGSGGEGRCLGRCWVAAGGRSLLGGGGSLENRDGGWLFAA